MLLVADQRDGALGNGASQRIQLVVLNSFGDGIEIYQP